MARKERSSNTSKAPTGIVGFDSITAGGLPRGRTTLFEGAAGSGKTLMALQTLVNGARLHGEPAVFVAFEETSDRIKANAATFGWDLDTLEKRHLFFLDAMPPFDLIQAGTFDLVGMLAVLEEQVRRIGARRIAFDAIDIILALWPTGLERRREMYRLHQWLIDRGLTAIITSKTLDPDAGILDQPNLGFLQFMVDCSVVLNHEVRSGVSQRSLRVTKYRGTRFSENEAPFLIGNEGLEVAEARDFGGGTTRVTSERVSSGVERLDAMLGGGYHRGASVLITGFPGTAKSTLAGAFAEAACQRKEQTLFISFDSDANEVVRNLASVNIRLGRFVKNGTLRLISARAVAGSAEIHLMLIRNLVRDHRARCVVIDPASALSKSGNEEFAHSVAERLVDWAKTDGITLLCTSLLSEAGPHLEGTPIQISTIADTWIHLSYLVHAGERNRALSIVKSRGTMHSNQVRELLLSDRGVTLADAYTAGGDVLMGTLRWEKERAVASARLETEAALRRQKLSLELEEASLAARIEALQVELRTKREEREAVERASLEESATAGGMEERLRTLRGADR